METNHIIEWAPFTLKPGINESDLRRASTDLHERFLKNQTGFIRRELLHQSDRKYVDLVCWQDRASADAAMKEAMKSTACMSYFHLMEEADPEHPEHGVQLLKVVARDQAFKNE
jgi:hypothetical protein